MSTKETAIDRWRHHQQPRRVDFTTPTFVRPDEDEEGER